MQYFLETVKVLEIELTTFCNASCGACDRNINGGMLNNKMPLHHMSFDTWQSITTKQNLSNISTLTFDGNFGDASMHPNIIKMLDYLSNIKKDLFIKVSSNGGARNTEFWKQLAIVLTKFSSHEMQFAIDGLDDTNHIYRRNVNWNKLVENITAFNSLGGTSTWRTIIFDHNKHQIHQMSKLAEQLGFYKFKTYRNRTSPIILDAYKELPSGTLTSHSIDEFERNYKVIKHFNRKKIPYEPSISFADYSCPFAEEQTVVVEPDGKVWPCCFIQGNTITGHKKFPYNEWNVNNLNEYSLEEILEHFRNKLYPAWKDRSYDICNKCLHKTNKPTQYNESI
jgi:radical SAM protein with 4Fe4S-binding SPASM domain